VSLTYACPSDLGIVTCYFNPCGFKVRAANFERFIEPIVRSGIPLVIVEARFEGDDEGLGLLSSKYKTLLVEARDVMWQKERLLDLGTAWLPGHCTKFAWLDADVLFEDPEWMIATSALLDDAVVVQPFAEVVRLPRGATEPRDGDETFQSFGAVYKEDPSILLQGKFDVHGHTGYAWAARRDVFARHGIYDACISGSGDHMMAHTFAGDWDSPCIRRMVGNGGQQLAHFRQWSRCIYEDVSGRLAFTPGRIIHLWHGTTENRRYAQRHKELIELAYDPREDIRISSNGCWEWATEKPVLHEWARRYFVERREDEDATP
jgi:hypothetical protein